MVLQLVDKMLWVFESHTYGYAFGFEAHAVVGKGVVYVAGRVACGEYHRASPLPAVGRHYSGNIAVFDNEASDACGKMNFASGADYGFAHSLDDRRQPVGAYVRVGVDEYVVLRAVLVEYSQHLFYRAALLAAGVQLAVGVCPGATLAETVIGIRVHLSLAAYGHHIAPAAVDVFAAFKHYGAYARLYQLESGKQSGRPCAHYNGFGSSFHTGINNLFGCYGAFINGIDVHGYG